MKIGTTVISATCDFALMDLPMPDGEYPGKWGGYQVVMEFDGKTFRLTTADGVRGFDIPCVVKVNRGMVTVEAE